VDLQHRLVMFHTAAQARVEALREQLATAKDSSSRSRTTSTCTIGDGCAKPRSHLEVAGSTAAGLRRHPIACR
jgi:hypothetical protein